ncbi:MAG: TonB-dependent receptor [Saprospiraceae bacterium]|nr:TonB-dependent receptor [Saprospiraceae bacterium]
MKKILLVFVLLAGQALHLLAQQDTTHQAIFLEETVISANRQAQSRATVSQQVAIINKAQIERQNAQTTADLLLNSGTAFVQKSQQGGGSPVLRGFEASRILLVIDGIRMNNAIYRAGHLQNIITVDNSMLDRAEILFGPASTVYGTDALGGAIAFYTKNPQLSMDKRFLASGNAFIRLGTVNEEKTVHADINLGGRKWAGLTSFTYSDFGDLRMGKNVGFSSPFGLRPYYAQRFGEVDSLVKNDDPYMQKFSGYQQYDVMQKIVFQQNAGLRHMLNVQYSNSSDIPRYDRLTDPKGKGLNSAEWYYGPQERLLAAYHLTKDHAGWFDGGLQTIISYQDIQESRHNRNFGGANRTDRVEEVSVIGFTANGTRMMRRGSLRLGLDAQFNDVTSTAKRVNVSTLAESAQTTRYPDGGSSMYNMAAYATHDWQSSNESWAFSEGIRVGYSSMNATFVDTSITKFPFSEVAQNSPLVSGSLGAVWKGNPDWRVSFNLSSGFRMPNVDDLAKVFDSQRGKVIVPNPDLGPEQSYNAEINVMRNLGKYLRWENVVWATALQNAIVTDVFQFNGKDSIVYDGTLSQVLANQNKREARLYGWSSNLEADVYDNLALFGSIAYTRGRILEDEGTSPLDHIPPMYGRVGARWHTPHAWVESFILFNGRKKLEDYNLEGEDNLQYAPANGMPEWATLNLRGGVNILSNLKVQAGIDNIFDTQYRAFASGINAPGRNFWVTLRAGF